MEATEKLEWKVLKWEVEGSIISDDEASNLGIC